MVQSAGHPAQRLSFRSPHSSSILRFEDCEDFLYCDVAVFTGRVSLATVLHHIR